MHLRLQATEEFPSHERYGLTAELRKTARSVVYNIAEGHRRCGAKEFARFLDISHGSAAELETQLRLSRALFYLASKKTEELLAIVDTIERMLTRLKANLRAQQAPTSSPNSQLITQEP